MYLIYLGQNRGTPAVLEYYCLPPISPNIRIIPQILLDQSPNLLISAQKNNQKYFMDTWNHEIEINYYRQFICDFLNSHIMQILI